MKLSSESLKTYKDSFPTKHIYLFNIFIPISQIFIAFPTKLEQLISRPKKIVLHSAIPALLRKESLTEVPNLEQLRTVDNKPTIRLKLIYSHSQNYSK